MCFSRTQVLVGELLGLLGRHWLRGGCFLINHSVSFVRNLSPRIKRARLRWGMRLRSRTPTQPTLAAIIRIWRTIV